MAGYDPNQPRDEEGQWTDSAATAAREAAGLEPYDKKFISENLSADDILSQPWAGNKKMTYKQMVDYITQPRRKGDTIITKVEKEKFGSGGSVSMFAKPATEASYHVQTYERRGNTYAYRNLAGISKVPKEVYDYYILKSGD